MIFQLRLFGLVIELLWMKGLLLGFSLPQGVVRALGLNLGPLCLCLYLEEDQLCAQCGRSLRWGLHGKLGRFPLCKPRAPKCRTPGCSERMTNYDSGLCDWHQRPTCPFEKQ